MGTGDSSPPQPVILVPQLYKPGAAVYHAAAVFHPFFLTHYLLRLYFSSLFLVLAKNKWAAEKKLCCGIKMGGDILLVYRRPMGFHILILYPVTFLNSINLRDSFDQSSFILLAVMSLSNSDFFFPPCRS